MNPATTHGAFSWAELLTSDPDAAVDFYTSILGYSVETMDMDTGPYHLLKIGAAPAAGIMALPDPSIPTYWGFYITVDDIDASAKKAVELGAKQLLPVMEAGNVGRFTIFQDPQGATFEMITYAYPPMEDRPEPDFADNFTTHGAFSWFELRTPDVEAAKAFYSALLGWTIKDMEFEETTYPVIHVGDVQMGGIIPPPMEGVPPHWAAYVTVDDTDAVAAAAREAGGQVLGTVDMDEVGRWNIISDPQGAVLSVMTYRPPQT